MKINNKISFLVLSVISYFLISCKQHDIAPLSEQETLSIRNGFFPLWQIYETSSNGGWQNNDNGRFSNDDASAMTGLLLLFEKTKDTIYIKHFFKISDRIISNTDVNRGIKDKYRNNKILLGWSSTRYTHDNSSHIFNLDDALIHIPFIQLYRFVNMNQNLVSEDILIKTQSLFEISKKSFEIFENDWKNIDVDKGYFHDPYFQAINIDTPINQSCVFSIYCSELYLATQDSKYKNYTIKTANYFKSILSNKEEKYLLWNYNTTPPTWTEDTGHGSWVAWFIYHSYKNKIAFNETDINRMISTFKEKIHKGDLFFSYRINGDGTELAPIIIHYFLYSEYDTEIKNMLSIYWQKRRIEYNSQTFLNHIGYHLIFFYGVLNLYDNNQN